MLDRTVRRRTLTAIVVAGVGLDQLTKYLATAFLVPQHTHTYLGGILQVWYTMNPGAFLSIGEHLSQGLRVGIFILGVSVVVIAAATYVWFRPATRVETLTYSLIVAGGLGNLIDRVVFQGQVRDFLYIGIGSVHTGVFNVADMLITAAALALVMSLVMAGRRDAYLRH
jgi:signal peptidase II